MHALRTEVGFQQYEVFEQDVSMALLLWTMLAICMLQLQGHLVQVHELNKFVATAVLENGPFANGTQASLLAVASHVTLFERRSLTV